MDPMTILLSMLLDPMQAIIRQDITNEEALCEVRLLRL